MSTPTGLENRTASRRINPILPGFHPDPTILRVGSSYFLATSSFEYFPGVPIYHSLDLVNWSLIGHALNRRSQLDLRTVSSSGGVYAPTLRYHKGRYYVAASVVYNREPGAGVNEPRGFYVSNENIWDDQGWSEPVWFDLLGIDQDLFFDDDDRVYLSTARFRPTPTLPSSSLITTYAVEIDLATGSSLTHPVVLRISPGRGAVAEGPHIIKKDGWYYLFTAEGGTGRGHHEVITRSRSPLGPYELPPTGVNPLVRNGEDPEVQRTGHMDLVEAEDGRWWAVMLAMREIGSSQLCRETFLAPMEWIDGWPRVNGGKPIRVEVEADLPEKVEPEVWVDNFDQDTLSPGWYNLRTPLKPFHQLSNSGLALYGNSQLFSKLESPAMLLRKQQHYSCSWSTELSFEPEREGDEAGTVVYFSNVSWGSISVRLKRRSSGAKNVSASNGQVETQNGEPGKQHENEGLAEREIVVRWTDPETDEVHETTEDMPSSMSVQLVITARPDTYTFSYAPTPPKTSLTPTPSSSFESSASPALRSLQTIPASILFSDALESHKHQVRSFVGTHFGLFAQNSEMDQMLTPARFSWARYVREGE